MNLSIGIFANPFIFVRLSTIHTSNKMPRIKKKTNNKWGKPLVACDDFLWGILYKVPAHSMEKEAEDKI